MFSWRTRSWNRKLTWQKPQELYAFVILYLMIMMMRWWRNYVVFFAWRTRVEHVSGSCSIAATQKDKKKNKAKVCFSELICSWSAVSRRHFVEFKIGAYGRKRERETKNLFEGFLGGINLVFKRFFVDGWWNEKEERLSIVDSKKYGHIKRESDWKMLTYGSIRMFFHLLMVLFVCFLFKETTGRKSKINHGFLVVK